MSDAASNDSFAVPPSSRLRRDPVRGVRAGPQSGRARYVCRMSGIALYFQRYAEYSGGESYTLTDATVRP